MLRKLAAAIALTSGLGGMLGSGVAFGLGLGDAILDSSLNQKLNAEIELIETRGLTAAEILPSLATAADFQRAGIERPGFLSQLEFSVVEEGGKPPFIRVTSKEPVVEPYINFLVEVHWPEGRLLKEYTLLLDLPMFSRDVLEGIIQPPSEPEESTFMPIGVAGLPSGAQADITSRSQPNTYQVRSGDTLTAIANEVRPQDVSTNRMMVGLQRENPSAFIDGNVNLLKQGVTLDIPDSSVLNSIDDAMARSAILEQNQQWRTNQMQLDATPRDQVTEPVRNTEEGRLSIVAGGNFSDGSGTGQAEKNTNSSGNNAMALESNLSLSQEQVDTLDRENSELKGRLRDLEDQIDTLEKLVVLRNDQLAAAQALESQLKKENDALASSNAASQSTDEVDYNFNTGAEAAKPEPETKPAPVPARPLQTAPAAKEDSGIGLVPIIGGGALALLTLLGGLLFLRRRQDDDIDHIYEDDDDMGYPDLDMTDEPVHPVRAGLQTLGTSAAAPAKAAPAAQSQAAGFDYDDDLDSLMDDFDDDGDPLNVGELDDLGGSGDDRGGFEFDLDSPEAAQPEHAPDQDVMLDLDALEAELEREVSSGNVAPAPAPAAPAQPAPEPVEQVHAEPVEESWDNNDFSLDDLDSELQNLGASAPEQAPTPAPAAALVDENMAQDLSGLADSDEVNTMLDLARAYIDMGDDEGARDILEEIVSEGSQAQQQEARQLLSELSG